MGRLQDKVCIVTGASSGIGAAAAELFAAEGAKVVLAARREAKLNAVAAKIAAKGGEASVVVTDISVRAQADALIAKAVELYGKIDVLVNDAGACVAGLDPVDGFSDEALDLICDVNLKGTMYVTRAALNVMAEQTAVIKGQGEVKGIGNIINVSSVSAVTGCGGAPYMATKGAIISLTKHIALRYATKRSIRANCLCPGSVWTDMTKRELAAQPNYSDKANEFNASIGQHSSAGVGISNTADMANILVFLASDESKAINGQIITADYGCNL